MRQLTLTEHRPSGPIELTVEERDALQSLVSSLTITPVQGVTGRYHLQPGSTVGMVRVGDLTVEIQPKLPIERVLFLVSYALDPRRWQTTQLHVATAPSLVEAVIPTFVAHVRQAFRPGLLQGYRYTEDSLSTVRGRIRFSEQIRRRHGIFPPIEVAFDEFTEDIDENRLIKAAIGRLAQLQVRALKVRRALHSFHQLLADVAPPNYDPRQLPEVGWTRLNEHYRPAVELARLILGSASVETRHGKTIGTAVLFNMNEVFENFVYAALRESLRLSTRSFPQGAHKRPLHLDAARQVRLRPDLSWWEGNRCVFVGDVKYKRTDDGIKHPDLYQLLSYTIATELPEGVLVYAAGEADDVNHDVSLAAKTLRVRTLELSGEPHEVLAQIDGLADLVRISARRSKRPLDAA